MKTTMLMEHHDKFVHKEILDSQEVMELLHFKKSTLERLIRAGAIKPSQLIKGGKRFFSYRQIWQRFQNGFNYGLQQLLLLWAGLRVDDWMEAAGLGLGV